MARTERESDRKREVADLLVLPKPAKACRMAQALAEKLAHTGPAEKERVASVPQTEQVGKYARATFAIRQWLSNFFRCHAFAKVCQACDAPLVKTLLPKFHLVVSQHVMKKNQ